MLQAECEEFVPSLRLIGDKVCQGLDCFLNDWQALKGANTGNEGSNASPTLTTDRADLFIFAEAQIDQDMDRFFFNLVDMLLESFKLCLIHWCENHAESLNDAGFDYNCNVSEERVLIIRSLEVCHVSQTHEPVEQHFVGSLTMTAS